MVVTTEVLVGDPSDGERFAFAQFLLLVLLLWRAFEKSSEGQGVIRVASSLSIFDTFWVNIFGDLVAKAPLLLAQVVGVGVNMISRSQ